MKILILDDDSDFRKLLARYLKSEYADAELDEYDPVEKGIPGEAFDWSRYEVLILDYNLQIDNLTGLDILQANRDNPMFPATVMLTGEGSEEIAVQALKSGVTDYLRKEKLDKNQLRASVQEAFDKYTSRQVRLYSLNEARQLARKEAQKILAIYKDNYDRVQAREQARLQQERRKLETELKKNQEILDKINDSRYQAEQKRTASEQELKEITNRQKEAEAAVIKANWKMNQEEVTSKIQFEDDLKSFRDEMDMQARATKTLSTQIEKILEIKAAAKRQAKAAEAEQDRNLLDDIATQLDKEGKQQP